jgi:MobC-like protein
MNNRKKEGKRGFPCLVETRLTQEKFTELTDILGQSVGIRSMSELVRMILDGSPIAIRAYDGRAEELLKELASIQKELQYIGNNVNQITKRFHSENIPGIKLEQAMAVAEKYQLTEQKIQEALSVIQKITEQWWPE